jgi:peptidase YpeB-like protein
MKYSSLVAAAAVAFAGSVAHAQATYKRDIPDSLAKLAKITEDSAAAIAQKRVPKGTIESVELEREKGKLMFSYDIKTAGKSGADEVNVDAMTGKIIGFSHESAAMEKKEAAAEAKEAKKVPPKKP